MRSLVRDEPPNRTIDARTDNVPMKFFVPILLAIVPILGFSEEAWVASIGTSSKWAVFPCKDYWVTNVCGTDKDYTDPGALPPVVSVGDTITYSDKEGKRKQFVVRHIRFFVFDKDVDFKSGEKRFTAKKGETTCSLYDAKSRSATRDTEYPSKIVINDCELKGPKRLIFNHSGPE